MNLELAKTILYFLAGGFLIFLAITITRDNFANRLNRVTGAMLGLAGLGPVFMAIGVIAGQSQTPVIDFENSTLYNLSYVWEFFFGFLLVFSWIYPVDRFRRFKHPRLIYIVFIPQTFHMLVIIFSNELAELLAIFQVDPSAREFSSLITRPLSKLFSWILISIGYIRSFHDTVFGAINLLYVLIATYFLETGRQEISNPRLMAQTKVVLWGTRIGLGLYVLAHLGATVLPYRLPEDLTTTIMILAMLSGTGIFIFATIRHQFLDVRLIFKQSFVYTIASAVLVGLYIVIVIKSRTFLTPIFGEQAEVISYIFIAVALLIFQPISNWLENVIRAIFIGSKSDPRNVLERFSRQVISQFDPKRIRQIIEEMLKTSLLVDRVYFVLFDDNIDEYAVLASDDFPRRWPVQRDDLMLRGINLLDRPTHFHSLANYQDGSELSEVLKERRVRLILPMKDAEHLLGFIALTDKVTGYRYTSDDFNLLGVLSNQMVTVLTNARLYVESLERIRLQEEVAMARQIQLDLLPSRPPQMERSSISAISTPSRTVGGDFYDFISLSDNRIGIVIADASGKGIPAALMIAQIQAIIRSELKSGNSISTMLKNVNQQISEATSPEKYVTLFYGEFDSDTGILSYSNAGHNYPIVVRADGSVELLKTGGTVLGALPMMEYESATTQLEENDMLFMFTDGLSEAMNEAEEEYSEERIIDFLCKNRHHEPQVLVDKIIADVRLHDPADPPQDDTTVVALKINGSGVTSG